MAAVARRAARYRNRRAGVWMLDVDFRNGDKTRRLRGEVDHCREFPLTRRAACAIPSNGNRHASNDRRAMATGWTRTSGRWAGTGQAIVPQRHAERVYARLQNGAGEWLHGIYELLSLLPRRDRTFCRTRHLRARRPQLVHRLKWQTIAPRKLIGPRKSSPAGHAPGSVY